MTSKWVLESKGIFVDIEDEVLRTAVKYFLAELPLYLNTPEILNVSSSLFVYKDSAPPFLQNIYNENLLVSPRQGYLTVKIEGSTNNVEDSERKNSIYIKNILNQVSGSVYWKDSDGIYLGCNQKEAELVGLSSPEDLIGKTDYDLSWKHIADTLKKTDQRIMNTRISEEVIETPKLASGEEVVMLSRKSPLYDDENNVIGIIGVSIDITAYKRAEELEAQKELQQKEVDLQNKIKNIFEKFVKNISFTLTELAVTTQNNKNLTEEERIDITSKAIGIKSITSELLLALQENKLDRFTG